MNKEEARLGKFYEILLSDEKKEKIFLPDNVTEGELVKYVEKMIELNQPRMLRKENRKPDIKDYKIPVNYFVVESNSVNFNSSRGVMMDAANSDDIMDNLNRIRDDDLGVLIIYHIFKNGRKTLDELVTEMTGYDKMMLTLLINKLHIDGYLRQYKEEDGLETFELVEREWPSALKVIETVNKMHEDEESEIQRKKKLTLPRVENLDGLKPKPMTQPEIDEAVKVAETALETMKKPKRQRKKKAGGKDLYHSECVSKI